MRKLVRAGSRALWMVGAAGLAAALVIQFRIHVANEWQQYQGLPAALAHTKGDRVVVFAPHSDDETLACGGMLALAARNGARLRVVLVTNGDGYRIAVGTAYKTMRVTPAMCVEFAYRRQAETRRALAALGVQSSAVTFLGYPDRGIAALWERHWGSDKLYLSHATGTNHSPYVNSFTPNAPYCGESLLADIQQILESEKPTDVYIPHPCDNHSDHFATYCFVTAAIEQLRLGNRALAGAMRVHTYLVHRGDWPAPKGYHPEEPLAPPYALAMSDTNWRSLQLPQDVVRAKLLAIKSYKTQTAIERGFLMSFVRRNEITGSIPARRASRVAAGLIKIDGNTEDWWGIPPAVIAPIGDYLMAQIDRGGGVRAIYLCFDEQNLYVRVDFARRVSKRITYDISFRGLGRSDSGDRFAVSIRPPKRCRPEGTRWAYSDDVIELSLPIATTAPGQDLFVRVDTRLMKFLVDNTGWRRVALGAR